MKRTASILAVLMLAAPAWAGITVTASQPIPDVNEIIVEYVCGDANLPRAFALDISVSGTNTVLSEPYDIHSEFYVYIGSIQISGGQVSDYGGPVADSSPNSMTIEVGSLYAANDPCHTSPPPSTGIICKFTVESNDCSITVSVEGNAARGKVVMEDADITYNDPGYVTYQSCEGSNPLCSCCQCQCWGDITDSTAIGPPDGQVDLGDFTRMSMELMMVGHPYIITPIPFGLECFDMTDSTAIGCPDCQIDLGDFTRMSMHLMAYAHTGYVAPCMTLPPGC